MKIFAETERLVLREILPEDLDGIYELDSDPEVHKFLGNKPITSKEQAADTINFIRQQYIDHGIGRWAVIDRETKNFMGWTGLKFVTTDINNHTNFYDLGYRLIRKYWGKGIATETAILSLNYAFTILKTTKVYGMASLDNLGSNKVLQKAGLKFIESFDFNGIMHNWYEIDKKDFKIRPGLTC